MAIYTKTGDAGTTALFDGTRVPKNSLRVDTYGTFDELNAQVSVCEKLVVSPDNKTCASHITTSALSLMCGGSNASCGIS